MLRTSQSSSGASSIGVPPRHPPTRCTRPSTWPVAPGEPVRPRTRRGRRRGGRQRRSRCRLRPPPRARRARRRHGREAQAVLRLAQVAARPSGRGSRPPRRPRARAPRARPGESTAPSRSDATSVPALTCPAAAVPTGDGRPDLRRAAVQAARALAERHPALARRRRAHGRRHALDQLRRPRASRPGLPRLRGAVPLPGPEPPARSSVAGRLRHVAADPSARPRLLLRTRPGARHDRGPRAGSSPSRSSTGARSRCPGRCWRGPGRSAGPRPGRRPRGRLHAPLLHDRDEVELAVRLGLPDLRQRPRSQLAGDEEREPPRVRGGGRPAPGRPRRRRRADLAAHSRGPRVGAPRTGRGLKLDKGVSGFGNALLELGAAATACEAIELEDPELDVEDYLAALDDEGGIVEERIEGDSFRARASSCA